MTAPQQTALPQDERRKPLAWQAHPMRELVRLAWPITISMLSFSTMSLVDALLVGHLGAASLAGVGLGSICVFVAICFPLGVLRAAKTLASQAVGAGRRDELASTRGAAVAFALVTGGLAILAGTIAGPYIARLSIDAATGNVAHGYLAIRVLSAPLVLVYRALRETLYAEGDTRTPMVATLVGNAVNIVLATALVYGLELGVEGAASATVFAHAVETGILFGVQLWRRHALVFPRGRHVAAFLRLGLPSGAQFILEVGSFFILTLILQRTSHVQGAAHQAALHLNHVAFLPAFAIAEAAAVLVGQAVGAGRDELVKALARRAMLVASAYTGTCAIVMLVFARQIVSLFASPTDPSAGAFIDAATPLLWIQAAFIVFDGANVVSRSVLGGTGDVRFPAIVGITAAWLMTPPLSWLLCLHFGWGAAGGWIGLCAETILASTILVRRLERGGWQASAIASRERLAKEETFAANEDREVAEAASTQAASLGVS